MGKLSQVRKGEIGGILIMSMACLCLLSILSFHPGDHLIVRITPASDVFTVERADNIRVHNRIGVVGAAISYILVDELFGYMSTGIPLFLFILGWHLFRNRNLLPLIWHAAYITWTMFLLSTTLGWFTIEPGLISPVWSGHTGMAAAGALQESAGERTLFILLSLLLITFLAPFRHDLQRMYGVLKNRLPRGKKQRLQKDEVQLIRSENQAGAVPGESFRENNLPDLRNQGKSREMAAFPYTLPAIDLLDSPPPEGNKTDPEEIEENKRIIRDKLGRHNIRILNIHAIVGPTVTLYELEPAPDVKIDKIRSYATDLKMATSAHGLRVITPIPGRSAVGIEIPNKTRETVYIRSLIETREFRESGYELPLALGKTIENNVFIADLTRMPHLLMAGATGAGKSVGIHSIIACLLYKCHPDDLKFIMIDPKRIEFTLYSQLKNHFLAGQPGQEEPIVTDPDRAYETLQSVCGEMAGRYDLLKMAKVNDIRSYNNRYRAGDLDEESGHRYLPYIAVIIDELADLMLATGRKIEEPLTRIAQLARAIGIHLVVATQRPSVNVITGSIKANFPVRMAYRVASKVDSRTILDVAGADQLVGNGDLLFTAGGKITRLQNAFVSTGEIEKITAFINRQTGCKQPFYLPA